MRNRMKKTLMFITAFCTLFFSIPMLACESDETSYLVQMINQLEALKPLVLAAAKVQPKNLRISFNYTALLKDINEIEKGIEANLTDIPKEPRQFEPIKGDYLNDPT